MQSVGLDWRRGLWLWFCWVVANYVGYWLAQFFSIVFVVGPVMTYRSPSLWQELGASVLGGMAIATMQLLVLAFTFRRRYVSLGWRMAVAGVVGAAIYYAFVFLWPGGRPDTPYTLGPFSWNMMGLAMGVAQSMALLGIFGLRRTIAWVLTSAVAWFAALGVYDAGMTAPLMFPGVFAWTLQAAVMGALLAWLLTEKEVARRPV